jgi:hypothetical protein
MEVSTPPENIITVKESRTEERQSKRRRLLPGRLTGFHMHDRKLCDILPQPPIPAALMSPPTGSPPTLTTDYNGLRNAHIPLPVACSTKMRILDTPPNGFSVFRRYHTRSKPSHDPDAQIDLKMLSNIVHTNQSIAGQSNLLTFNPYPNKSAFLLGEWFWTEGTQKSQRSFMNLLDVLGRPGFSITDVQSANWTQINKELAINDWDKPEWIDEDAGWQRSPVTIQVPFYHNAKHPGIQDFTIENFYHRSLTSVIRDKLSNKHQDFQHFHLEPYELIWHPPHLGEDIRLQGELYTSPVFNAAHQDLQAASGEPGCNLPRVVALMFWSDGTQLTNFGKAKLWPIYMFFGNESKYRRCKPSEDLCEHIAYLEDVSHAFCFSFTFIDKVY